MFLWGLFHNGCQHLFGLDWSQGILIFRLPPHHAQEAFILLFLHVSDIHTVLVLLLSPVTDREAEVVDELIGIEDYALLSFISGA